MTRSSSSANVEPMQPFSEAIERKAIMDLLMADVISLLFLLVIHIRMTEGFPMQ